MSLGAFVKSTLAESTEVSSLVSDRVFPAELPQASQLPAIVYTEVSDGQLKTLGGKSKTRRAMIQFDVYSKDYDEAGAVYEELEKFLSARVRPGLDTWVHLPPSRKGIDDQTKYHRASGDFSLWRNGP